MDLKEIAPIFGLIFTMAIPAIVILTKHQQKMTLLLRQDHLPPTSHTDLVTIQYEVQQLKDMVASLALSVDSLKDEVRNSNQLQERVRIEQ